MGYELLGSLEVQLFHIHLDISHWFDVLHRHSFVKAI